MSLGSNLGDGEANIEEALQRLEHYGNDLVFDAQSPIYKTEPQGAVKDQPWFTNCVVRFKVGSDIWAPEGLLSTLQAVEAKMGRERDEEAPGGPRLIDMDLLLFGDVTMQGEYLTLPHPRMLERAFVLVPLKDIAPGLTLPGGKTVEQALAGIGYTLDGRNISQK
ncbi:MAG TPA: 2-amino-4-hydroxy-6-hydroxymethyldihydropteridine diphosphokinase [Humidesulfovibrio sp.]|uniref:2-amino-4-hydroxy-6- hydroxymethyldihydropteridine diphosphokinase n=1 Tax=Humidesulfovibrio sp. TaxID=2910988 RepID=UPI002BF47106|nr:2-amino-4-hydroxy-6-hydroxymethyldihydropteridine diphosphokinase [Humidesulfovibrio sp.]HWR05006.1 2-amino-4-hydroxy-6-hydroxymethyldihydropteridine diphosphokinase [Humidesulfovibrio sp.]